MNGVTWAVLLTVLLVAWILIAMAIGVPLLGILAVCACIGFACGLLAKHMANRP